MSNPVIEVDNLGKRYRIGANKEQYLSLRDELSKWAARLVRRGSRTKQEFWALRDVSFAVEQGETLGIIGRNGAGKSTLLKLLSRITFPTTGKIVRRGRVASLLEVGTGFHPELTGRENIYLNGAILGMTRREITRKFDEIVAFSEIEQFLDTPVKRYSSGMYVRLAFAVAAHLEPEVLVVDEVLAVGDAAFQKKCLGKMGDVAKGGRTVLFVSHNMAAVQQLCRTGIVLEAGRIKTMGDIDECVESYIGQANFGQSILTHVTKCDPAIELHSIMVNNQDRDQIDLDPRRRDLEVVLRGVLRRPLPITLEARIKDIQDTPLAFFSPGHERGEVEETAAGEFELVWKMELPRLMKGSYNVTLYFTNPGKAGWIDVPGAVTIYSPGTATQTGMVFDYSESRGFMLLPEIKSPELPSDSGPEPSTGQPARETDG